MGRSDAANQNDTIARLRHHALLLVQVGDHQHERDTVRIKRHAGQECRFTVDQIQSFFPRRRAGGREIPEAAIGRLSYYDA